MATLVYQWSGDGIARITHAMEALGGPRAQTGLRRAINRTGEKAYTHVKRALVKQMGLPSQKLFSDDRALKTRRASVGHLAFEIQSSGKAIRAKEFRHRVGQKGITFYPWNVRHFIRSAFVIPAYGGNFYRRRTAKRFPLEALYGPNINKELVKDLSAAAFNATVAELPARVEHEIRVITDGIVS